MIDKIKNLFNDLNKYGIAVPLVKDPKTNSGSFSATILVLSSTVVLIGLIGKMAKLVDGVDLQQALYWFMISSGLYFGRNLSTNNVKMDNNEGNKN